MEIFKSLLTVQQQPFKRANSAMVKKKPSAEKNQEKSEIYVMPDIEVSNRRYANLEQLIDKNISQRLGQQRRPPSISQYTRKMIYEHKFLKLDYENLEKKYKQEQKKYQDIKRSYDGLKLKYFNLKAAYAERSKHQIHPQIQDLSSIEMETSQPHLQNFLFPEITVNEDSIEMLKKMERTQKIVKFEEQKSPEKLDQTKKSKQSKSNLQIKIPEAPSVLIKSPRVLQLHRLRQSLDKERALRKRLQNQNQTLIERIKNNQRSKSPEKNPKMISLLRENEQLKLKIKQLNQYIQNEKEKLEKVRSLMGLNLK